MSIENKLGLANIGIGTLSEVGVGSLLPRTRNTTPKSWDVRFDQLPDPDLENDAFGYFDATGSTAELNKLRSQMARCSKTTGKKFVTRTVQVHMAEGTNTIVRQTIRIFRTA